MLTLKDLERLQQQQPDLKMELVAGEIIVMSPSGYNSDEVAANLIIGLGSWVKPRRLGRVTASSAGFELPGRTCAHQMSALSKPNACRYHPKSSRPWPPIWRLRSKARLTRSTSCERNWTAFWLREPQSEC